uniref:NADH-plastoquinone oxidoreductase subunit K n=1 Tax=Corydalis trisecta TaxID=2682942 RepID=A0A6B9QHP3_9MAGN|nr:NADH-plastoquinone oxidoreductase subunit K [Corydalis trisecta]
MLFLMSKRSLSMGNESRCIGRIRLYRSFDFRACLPGSVYASRMLDHKEAIKSHLSWASLFRGSIPWDFMFITTSCSLLVLRIKKS